MLQPDLTSSRRSFYKAMLLIAIPIIIQNGITNFVNLLDNVMVGAIGQEKMSGVAIANRLLFVFNLCTFGASSGAGIFAAQFHGKGDHRGVRYAFRFKILVLTAVSVLGCSIFLLAGQPLISLFLKGEGDRQEAALTLAYGMDYLRIMLLGLLPFAISNAYSSTLRESGQTLVPMLGGVSAVLTNLCLNWVLIFGKLGLPAMGVRGAAIATVISRYVELGVVALWTHLHGDRHPFIRGAYRSFYIPGQLLGKIVRKGMPLLLNEFMWSVGLSTITQSYSTVGLAVVPAINIVDTIRNLCSVVQMAMGNAVGILMGQLLGSGLGEQEVRRGNRRALTATVLCAAFFGLVLAAIAPFFPRFFEVTPEVRSLSTRLILVCAVLMPFDAFALAGYFTLRSGGKTLTTFLFDSGFTWAVMVPLAFLLCRFTDLPMVALYAITQGTNLLKCVMGIYMIRRGSWIRNLTED